MHLPLRALLPASLALFGLALAAGLSSASAQVGPPPATFLGTVNDASRPLPEGLPVEAYVGDVECSDGQGTTGWWGEGADRVTLYVVDVWSQDQRPGCGTPGATVRIKVGDSFVNQTGQWSAGLVRLDVSIGSVTPVPMPTVTPGPAATNTPATDATTAPGETAEPGSTSGPQGTASPGTETPTVRGGVTTNDPSAGASSDNGNGGLPVWLIVMLVLGGVAAVGGGVGMIIARSNRAQEDDLYPPVPGSDV